MLLRSQQNLGCDSNHLPPDRMAGLFSNAFEMITELLALHALQYLQPIWKGVDEQLRELHRTLVFIQPTVEDAEERQLTDKAVRGWLLELKDAASDAEDILDEAKTHELLIQRKEELSGHPRSEVREFFRLDHNTLLFKLQLGDKLRNVNERIISLIKEMNEFNLRVVQNNSISWRNRPQTHSFVRESRAIGRDEDKDKLVQMLIRDTSYDIAVVSIVSMGGMGKTTLAQLVYGDERIKKQFKLRIWVCRVLQQRLRKELGQKRYLLVLDDVWNEDFQKWDALRNMLLDGGEGSRILVTTRNEKCSRVMGVQKPYFLSRLSEESSWNLFEQKAFSVGVPKPPKLLEIGQEIVKKCQGLPLAIEVMGCIMHCKSEESEWQAVLENIETWKLQNTQNEIIRELWLSYVDLPTHLKKCFAFCSIFPKDHNLEEEKLIQFWMAHGYIPSQKGNDVEVEGRELFTELIRRSLLQYQHTSHAETIGRVCKMHDLINDLAYFVMENECFPSLRSSAATEISLRPRHLQLDANENYNQGDCSIIRTVLYCGRDLSLLSKLKLVRVLDLSGTRINKFPAAIEHLHHLRYLDISGTLIRKLPESICMLVNLQTLKLYGCREFSELPNSITYMNSLRHLIFDQCPKLKVFPAGLSRLQNLKTLTRFTVGDDANNNIRQLKFLNLGGKVQLYNLQKVKNAGNAQEANLRHKENIDTLILNWGAWDVAVCDEYCSMEIAEEVLEALKPHANVKELEVFHYPGKQFPMWMQGRQQFQYLHRIELLECRECEQLPPLEILPCLEYLRLWKMDGIKHIVNNRGGNALQSFPALKKLILYDLKNLEGWCLEEGKEANLSLFPCLIHMVITGCPKLTTLPLKILPRLEDLSISHMDGIKHIASNRRGNALQSCPALKNLRLESMWNLEGLSVEEGREANQSLFPCLISMDIRRCPKLTTTMPPIPTLQKLYVRQSFCETQISLMPRKGRFFKHLKSLRRLTIHSCTEELFLLLENEEEARAVKSSLEYLAIENCNQLSLTLVLQNLTSLRELWVHLLENLVSWPDNLGCLKSLNKLTISSCNNLIGASSQGDHGPPFLKDLHVSGCAALRELPTCPKSLQSLSIDNCPLMESLWPEVGHLTSLSRLEVSLCPKLVSLSDEMQALTSLQYLSIAYCPALKSFPEGLQQLLPTLKSLTIQGCPKLGRLCKPGGAYYDLFSTILDKRIEEQPKQLDRLPRLHGGEDYDNHLSTISDEGIGAPPEQTVQVPHVIITGAKQALKCIATKCFLLLAGF
ncbi:putative disease resistance protein RGA3 [Dioscorea cayenensis subsp. rotundata]|uniref:Disease resistance protein RGA3 n=1 Tax=Dioscorea cayennensis subsp. rotundata TaxID=55577 RepID=A0AB40BWN6_DIOCR|nr:putative disease resistance protein RGA3 [Dioscorea cayenensis subsp. rotundata]